MNSTLFLGIATMLNAFGVFAASQKHLYSSYVLLALAFVMVLIAFWVTYRTEYRKKWGRQELRRVLLSLTECRRLAYEGGNRSDYQKIFQQVEQIKQRVGEIAAKIDPSIESGFLAITVLDFPLDESMKKHFAEMQQIEFQQIFQNVQGWRGFINDTLKELR